MRVGWDKKLGRNSLRFHGTHVTELLILAMDRNQNLVHESFFFLEVLVHAQEYARDNLYNQDHRNGFDVTHTLKFLVLVRVRTAAQRKLNDNYRTEDIDVSCLWYKKRLWNGRREGNA
jgi:hypothetical protein